eukprot:CAMPEP_0116895268 /NCGR_PEP_ID=MMETSP0467-20121206/4829_1 /TAXON_ID=283647 /ORGANISM="Mesodinium pulex, Strain SPMC105" /LENGTH=65 /DNA_ID=CAMNT_0004565903 /DNA_START=640 /DNA_END=834 /DNA_ORIENTATION=-
MAAADWGFEYLTPMVYVMCSAYSKKPVNVKLSMCFQLIFWIREQHSSVNTNRTDDIKSLYNTKLI